MTSLLLCAALHAALAPGDTVQAPSPADSVSPPILYRWNLDSTQRPCREPQETASQCWRSSPRRAAMETGIPGARTFGLSLTTMEKDEGVPFFQPALRYSPYGLGGYLPFDRFVEGDEVKESWLPILPLDTPVTALHWSRGALQMNQFSLDLRRMVGNRAYLGLQFHSDRSDSQAYEYSFNVHQPYLSGWGFGNLYHPMDRDSASLVIQDTAPAVSASQFRPRLGFWIDSQTVLEVFADRFGNSSSLTNPSNPAASDSAQLLFPASFSIWTFGAIAAHSGSFHNWNLGLTHSAWNRELKPKGINAAQYLVNGNGLLDRFSLGWNPIFFWKPSLSLTLENSLVEKSMWLDGTRGAGPAAEAWSDRESFEFGLHPNFRSLGMNFRLEAARRGRADQEIEWLGGVSGDVKIPFLQNFEAVGGGGWKREGAPEDFLFRWQPALGLYPNPDLNPRNDMHTHAGITWKNTHLEVGIGWDRHTLAGSWLPWLLPEPDYCFGADTVRYPGLKGPFCVDSIRIADSVLSLRNYDEEIRDLYHLLLSVFAGNWTLSIHNTYLNPRSSTVKDSRMLEVGTNWEIPGRAYQGQLVWKRQLLRGKLGVETRWDWEWFSKRYVFASDLDGFARLQPLDEYLALDFTARMDVSSFLLYFRAVNLNHDRYATEAGVHPPGVNFRFGVDWRLRN